MNLLHWPLQAISVILTNATQAATISSQSHTALDTAAQLQVSAIDHVGINVPDIEAARAFSPP
jgi:hypothetical protein